MSRRARSVGSQGAGPCNYVSWQGVEYVWGGGEESRRVSISAPPRTGCNKHGRTSELGGWVCAPAPEMATSYALYHRNRVLCVRVP